MRLLDDGAGLGETLRRLAGDGGDLGIDRRDAEIGRLGNALRLAPERAADRNECRQRRQRQRIGRMLAAHGVEQQREVLDIARHRAVGRRGCGRSWRPACGRRGRCSAACRRCRRSSPGCAASRPCRSRARATPCRSRAPPRRRPEEPAAERDSVPRIARRAEHLVERVGAGAEFRRVRLGVDDRRHRASRCSTRMSERAGTLILEDRRALGGAHARDIGEVLDRHRHAGEQAALAGRLFHQRSACGAGAIEAQRRQRVDLADRPRRSAVSSTSSRSCGVTSPLLSLSTMAHAVAFTSP